MFYKHFLQITIMSWIGTLYIYVYKFEENMFDLQLSKIVMFLNFLHKLDDVYSAC